MKKILLLFVLICFSCVVAPANQLRGTVSIDVKTKTKPLDPLLWPGNYFDEKVATALLKNQSPNASIWKKIPAWQAGEWQSTQSINTKYVRYVHGKWCLIKPGGVYTYRHMMTIGEAKDKNGDIWERHHSYSWEQAEAESLTLHSFDAGDCTICFYIDKPTNRIVDVQQGHTWSQRFYLSPDFIKTEQKQTAYNEKGEPLYTSWNTTLYKRTKTFAEAEPSLSTDKELRKDFVNYLKNNGLANLIPTFLFANNGLPLSDEDINVPTSGEQITSKMAMSAQLQGHKDKPVERTKFGGL